MQPGNGTSQGKAPRPGGFSGVGDERSRRLRFGEFEFDPETLEPHRDEETIRLQPQPAKLLRLLTSSRGALVTREAVRRHLWSDEIHVEFDQSVNSCVRRVRRALDDNAESPRYIKTLPRLGYRFLQPVRGGRRRGRAGPGRAGNVGTPSATATSAVRGARRSGRGHRDHRHGPGLASPGHSAQQRR